MFRGANANIIPALLHYLYKPWELLKPLSDTMQFELCLLDSVHIYGGVPEDRAKLLAGRYFGVTGNCLIDSNTDASAQHQEAGANENNTHCLPTKNFLNTPDIPT